MAKRAGLHAGQIADLCGVYFSTPKGVGSDRAEVTMTKLVVHTPKKIYVAGLPFDVVDKAEAVRRLS